MNFAMSPKIVIITILFFLSPESFQGFFEYLILSALYISYPPSFFSGNPEFAPTPF